MNSAAPERVLRYSHASRLVVDGWRSDLRLAAADAPELLFEGRLLRPRPAARLLTG